MPINERVLTMPGQWAKGAQTNIPNPPVPGVAYRNVNLSVADIENGQHYDKVYDSARYNQIDYCTTGLIQALEQYGVLPWSSLTNYPEHAFCLGMDGLLYQALQASGPNVNNGPQNPSESDGYWEKTFKDNYELCEFYYFRHPTLKPGFQAAQGGLIQNAAELYPRAWAYLQTAEGQKLCVSEAAWQAMTTVTWTTLADGTKVGWNGIGGAPFFAPNLETGALRLPDLRGMYAEATGFDGLTVGGVHGDAIRNITGDWTYGTTSNYGFNLIVGSGAFKRGPAVANSNSGTLSAGFKVGFDAGLAVPTATKNQPRAWGALACVYLGV